MTTATLKRHNDWSKLFPSFRPNESIEETVERFIDGDDNRLNAAYQALQERIEGCASYSDELALATVMVGDKGPAAVIAEFFKQCAHTELVMMLKDAAKLLEDDDTPEEPPAPRASGVHAQEEPAADDDGDADTDADDDPDAVGRGVYDSAIPKARAIVAALQVVDGLPLWDKPNPGTPWCDDQGIAYAEFAVGLMLNHSIDRVVDKLPLPEQAKMLKLVTEQAKPYTGNGFTVKHDKMPVDTVTAAELLTRCGADVESLIEAFANREILYKVTEAIGAAIEAMLDAMPLEARARVYKLVHARAMQWREAVQRATK